MTWVRSGADGRLLGMVAATLLASVALPLRAQDLAPRAYLIVPTGSNAVTLGYAYNDGDVLLEGAVPVTDGTAKLGVPSIQYIRAFSLLGRTASVLAGLAYGVGDFEGEALGAHRSISRSGLFDSSYRLSVNLVGGPAMSPAEMRQWRQQTLLGVSLRIVAPTGQYDPTRLINLGTNRWSFKPELGYSTRFGHWLVDAYAGVWLYTRNSDYFSRTELSPGTHSQTQDPVGALELHLSYDVRPRFWVSLDGNFWYGGRTSIDGVENEGTLQQNSRIGLTSSFPLTRRLSLKLSYAQGAYIRFGGDLRVASAAIQYSWIDGVK